jgi:hypothetical protein
MIQSTHALFFLYFTPILNWCQVREGDSCPECCVAGGGGGRGWSGTVVDTERSSPGNFKVYIIHLLRFNRYSCAMLGFLSQPKGKT